MPWIHVATALPAPLRMLRSGRSMPLIRVVAVNSTSTAPSGTVASSANPRAWTRSTMLRPSGVSSAREDSWAAPASRTSVTPSTGSSSAACRLP